MQSCSSVRSQTKVICALDLQVNDQVYIYVKSTCPTIWQTDGGLHQVLSDLVLYVCSYFFIENLYYLS